MTWRRAALAVSAVSLVVMMADGCSGSASSPNGSTTSSRPAPNISGFLQLPVATPRVCPSTVSGSTVGRDSPWVGHVDVSVFLSPAASPQQVAALGTTVRQQPLVRTVYFESAHEAYAEFERLYTCSAAVPPSQTPASYRLVLQPEVSVASRNGLVAQLIKLPGVDSISCDPSTPCVNIVRSPQASATATP